MAEYLSRPHSVATFKMALNSTSTVAFHHFNGLDPDIGTVQPLVSKCLISCIATSCISFLTIAVFLLMISASSLYHRCQRISAPDLSDHSDFGSAMVSLVWHSLAKAVPI